MKTIILPGYSQRNKEWAEEVRDQMDLGHEVVVHNWKHWTSGSFSLKREIENIKKEIGEDKVNILAKSVGTRVAMTFLKDNHRQVNKLILCGIPGVSRIEIPRFNLYKYSINLLSPRNVLVIQNEKDPFGNYKKVEKFIKKVNAKVETISKFRSDHNYPYPSDFQKFLRDRNPRRAVLL